MSADQNQTTERHISTAPRDGRRIEVRSIQDGSWWRMYWWPEGNSWNDDCSALVITGVWTDDDGWFQPNEVDAWRKCQE